LKKGQLPPFSLLKMDQNIELILELDNPNDITSIETFTDELNVEGWTEVGSFITDIPAHFTISRIFGN